MLIFLIFIFQYLSNRHKSDKGESSLTPKLALLMSKCCSMMAAHASKRCAKSSAFVFQYCRLEFVHGLGVLSVWRQKAHWNPKQLQVGLWHPPCSSIAHVAQIRLSSWWLQVWHSSTGSRISAQMEHWTTVDIMLWATTHFILWFVWWCWEKNAAKS